MLPADVEGEATERTPAENQTVRNVFVVGPDKKVKLILVYPMTTGRNFDEVLRVIDSLQLTAKHKVATPAKWEQGDDVIIAGSVSTTRPRRRPTRTAGSPRGPTSGSCRSRASSRRARLGRGGALEAVDQGAQVLVELALAEPHVVAAPARRRR